MQRLTLQITVLLLATSVFGQSPWINPKGSFYGQLGSTFLSYSSIFNEGGDDIISSGTTTSDMTIGLYGEYSITNRTSTIVNLPFKSVQSNGESLAGLGDIELTMKHQPIKDLPIAVYYAYTAPLSKREGALRTGYKQHVGELGLSAGGGKPKFYYYGTVGFKARNNIPNQVKIDSEFGYIASVANKPLLLMFHIQGALNTSSTLDPAADQSVLYHNNGEYLSPGLKFGYNAVSDFWINVAMFGAMNARKMGAAPTISVGIAYESKK